MKTIRTIIATLSGVLLTFALVAWFSVRRNAAFIQRTIYQGFDQTFVVALVMGCAFLLIAVILSVAIVSTEDDEEDEDEEEPVRPQKRLPAEKRAALPAGEQPYRRVTRARTLDQDRTVQGTEEGFVPADRSAPKKRVQAAERPDEIDLQGVHAPVKKGPKGKRPRDEEPSEANVEPDVDWQPLAAEEPTVPASEADVEEQPEPEIEAPASEPEPVTEEPEPKIEPETPETGEAPEAEEPVAEAPAEEPRREETTVRCVFCGKAMPRDSRTCPHCGKKR